MIWKARGWQAAALAVTVANPLLHKPVSDVCDWARARWGFSIYDRVALIAIPVATLVAIAVPLAARRSLRLRPELLMAAAVLVVVSVGAQRWLLVANIELIHFPQYVLLSAMLLAGGLSASAAFLFSTAAGVIDEAYQHLVVYAGRTDTYFDINDIVLNAIGAAWGVVLLVDVLGRTDVVSGFSRTQSTDRRQPFVAGAVLSIAALGVSFWLDPPQFVPMFKSTTTGHQFFRVLSSAEGVVMVALLWAFTVAVTDRRRLIAAVPISVPRSVAAWLGLLLILASSACGPVTRVAAAAPDRPAAPVAPSSDSFIITFWCGPPFDQFTDARAEEIVAAGFNVVGPPCERPTGPFHPFEALEVAARHGLKMWIADPRYNERARTVPDWQDQIARAVADYKDRPGFGGYFLADEPSAPQFADLGAIAARIRELDPGAFIYVNVLADYIPRGWGTPTYREYVEQFVTTVRPSILSYDYYTFLEHEDRPTFFSNLALIRDVAQEHHMPFMLIFLAMPHGPYRDPTEAELSWQALHALAYGASGIAYFTYWTPVDVEFQEVMHFRHGLIENGKPTRHYDEAARLNREVRTAVRELRGYRSVSIARADELPALSPILSIDSRAVTIGIFASDEGTRKAMIVNQDYRGRTTLALRLQSGAPLLRFDARASGWTKSGTTLELPRAGFQLLRWATG
jgi:hypothetical protein